MVSQAQMKLEQEVEEKVKEKYNEDFYQDEVKFNYMDKFNS